MEQLILLVKYQTKPNKRKDFVKKVISSGVLEKIRKDSSNNICGVSICIF